jgi:hypothetical protein
MATITATTTTTTTTTTIMTTTTAAAATAAATAAVTTDGRAKGTRANYGEAFNHRTATVGNKSDAGDNERKLN